jgi:hypothetical protein
VRALGASAALMATLSACSSQQAAGGPDLRGPSAAVVFQGLTHRHPGEVRSYLAVVSTLGDEIRILDLDDNAAVRSPGFAFPLSVPTARWPVLAAAAPASDQQPDALVVVSEGELRLQLVSTWDDGSVDPNAGPRVVSEVDLSSLVPAGTEIFSIIGAPGLDTSVSPPGEAPGTGRILVGLTGALAVVEFRRAAGGAVEQARPAALLPLDFDPVSLALDPDLYHVYCATPNEIIKGSNIFGVGEIDTRAADPASWTVKALRAGPPPGASAAAGPTGTPTRLVAAALVGERRASDHDSFAAPVRRVYAALDPDRCGGDWPMRCGIAILDPVAGELAADLATDGPAVPAQAFRAPLPVSGVPQAMAVALPPVSGAGRCIPPAAKDPNVCGGAIADGSQPLLPLAPFTGAVFTTGSLVVGSSDGGSYVYDLGRSSAPGDVSLLVDDVSRVRALGFSFAPQTLGLWDLADPTSKTTEDLTLTGQRVQVTPGYTPADLWSVAWQGSLPGLFQRRAIVTRATDGSRRVYVAVQTQAGSGWIAGAQVDDPRLGIHPAGFSDASEPGDIAEIQLLDGSNPCDPALAEAPIEQIVPRTPPGTPADQDYPGGAISLGSDVPSCLDPDARGGRYDALVTVLAHGFVLVGQNTGYAGRPPLDRNGTTLPAFTLQWQPEEPLLADCPLLPPPSPPPVCTAARCRLACESLVLARKARRFFYPDGGCPTLITGEDVCAINYPYLSGKDPLVPGPVLAFRVGTFPDPLGPEPARGAVLGFATQSGVKVMSRQPSIFSQPLAVTWVDRSRLPNHTDDGTWLYVAYQGNELLAFPPGQATSAALTIR